MVYLGSLDSSRNLQENYAISFLFHLDLMLHTCKILIQCYSFAILNFAIKQGFGLTFYNWFALGGGAPIRTLNSSRRIGQFVSLLKEMSGL